MVDLARMTHTQDSCELAGTAPRSPIHAGGPPDLIFDLCSLSIG